MDQQPLAVIGTWSFSLNAVKLASSVLQKQSCVDAVEKGINAIENQSSYGKYLVGPYGLPNSAGNVELDAAIMDGRNLMFGAVMSLKRVANPISVARKVMEKSPHNILVGAGANVFAEQQGFVTFDDNSESPQKNFITMTHKYDQHLGHDTLGLLALDSSGNVCAGVSTSGMPYKQPGRVGDSPLPGCGLYADYEAGAACCTGDGDEILKYCPSFQVVNLMKQNGLSPQKACGKVINSIVSRLKCNREKLFEIGLIAVSTKGETGAATTVESSTDAENKTEYHGFPFVVWTKDMEEPMIQVEHPATNV